MGVLLQGFFKMPPNVAVPSPADGDATIAWWWDHLASQANELRQAGFTAVWLPPVLKTSDGDKPGSDGYGPFDDYDIGSKNQKGALPTRFGNREQLQRSVAILRANGLDVYLDMVEHQRVGDTTPFVFRYLGADGTPDVGRFPKNPPNFVPQVPRDPALGGPPSDDFPFGRELAPINAKPPHYVFDNLIAAADWLTRALDVQGYRIDDVKGLSTEFLLPFLTSKSMNGKFAVGEFFDGNRVLVNGWIFNPNGMKGRPNSFDFPTKFVLNAMCNSPGGFNMADLDHVGLTGISPLNAVTFVENHDTDLNSGEKIVINKMLGYAYILTSEGYPCVYYRDYSADKNCFGLKPLIDNLIWIHEMLAFGPTEQRWKDFNVFAYERLGAPNLLVGLNNDPNNARTITVATGFGPNVSLHDYTGHSPDVATDGNGSVTITIPKNQNGASYVCYSRQGFGGKAFEVTTHSVTQDFEGAEDLDIPPARNGKSVNVARIWSRANSPLNVLFKPDVTGWAPNTSITLDVLSPDGSVLATSVFKLSTPPGTALEAASKQAGFYTLRLTTAGAPAAKPNPTFTLSATYTATAGLQVEPDSNAAGRWGPVITLKNVPIHAHVLPTGKVLYWGRRATPGDMNFNSLNEHTTEPFLFDPSTGVDVPTATQPTDSGGKGINLFCSNHTFLADGRLMVVGGHLFDSCGIKQATIYDPNADAWIAEAEMNEGRWYPSAVTLSDGSVLVCSGSFATTNPGPPSPQGGPQIATNNFPQTWNNGPWETLTSFNHNNQNSLPLFPRIHLAPDGRIFMSGTLAESFFFDLANAGTWSPSVSRAAGARDYAPSVMYDVGKILYIGGGNDPGTHLPTDICETIDLNQKAVVWKRTNSMHFPRRQHNATLLPDGTVLVTGGTQGGGGPNNGFNDLTANQPVHAAERWDPVSQQWTLLAAEDVDRCYHSTAVLLPDGRVMSAGGGEYQPQSSVLAPNNPADSHPNCQIFSPPYLFKGARPDITKCPTAIEYGQNFEVGTSEPDQIAKVSMIRLPSVTHSFDQNQRINFLAPTALQNSIKLTAPPNAQVCPPGHYLLFLLNKSSAPSVARIIQVLGQPVAAARPVARAALRVLGPVEKDAAIVANAKRPPVVVGLTSTCPYGLAACWGGAYVALSRLPGVEIVRPMADAKDSVAFLYLSHDSLPDVANWPSEFERLANAAYVWRGVEVTLAGNLVVDNGELILAEAQSRPAVTLAPLQLADKVQLNMENGGLKPLPEEENMAFDNLSKLLGRSAGGRSVTVTGPLRKEGTGFVLEVRKFDALNA
jgi:galactose oxidase